MILILLLQHTYSIVVALVLPINHTCLILIDKYKSTWSVRLHINNLLLHGTVIRKVIRVLRICKNIMEILSNIPINWAKYRKGKIEKDFEAEVFRHLRKHGYFSYHIQDIWLGTRLLDWIIISPQWLIFLIEFKKTDGYTFNLSQFEPSQIQLLTLMKERNAPAYIMVYSQKTKTYWFGTYEYLISQANSVWWIKLFETWTSKNLQSK